jgi:hypothetical protein
MYLRCEEELIARNARVLDGLTYLPFVAIKLRTVEEPVAHLKS